MKITIFTVSIEDNGYLNQPLQKFCISSWYPLADYFTKHGIKTTVKIFDYNDPEVLQYEKECKDQFENELKISRKANAFRMYILSKHENYLWLDADVYCYSPELVFKSFDFNSKFISKTWSKLYNANDLAYFKNIYQAYIDYLYPQKCDRRMMEALNLDMSWNKIPGLTHLFYLENYPNANWIQISNIADVPYTEDRISWRQKTVYFYKGECLVSDGAFALYNDKNLINFINTNYSDKIKII